MQGIVTRDDKLIPEGSVGFSGTQKGATTEQLGVVGWFLERWKATEIHIGSCVGADEQVFYYVRRYFPELTIYSHPSDILSKRALIKADYEFEPKHPLARNVDIVNGCRRFIATPYQAAEQRRSGTWSAIRYARKLLNVSSLVIVRPDGIYVMERGN